MPSCPIKLSIETTLFYCLSCPCLFLNHDVHSPGQGYWRHSSAAALIGNHGQWPSRRLSAKVTSHLVKTSRLEVAADALKGIPGHALARDGHVEKYGTVLRITSFDASIRWGRWALRQSTLLVRELADPDPAIPISCSPPLAWQGYRDSRGRSR